MIDYLNLFTSDDKLQISFLNNKDTLTILKKRLKMSQIRRQKIQS